MIFRSIKIYLRVLAKRKVLTLINLIGLALGIASCLYIWLYVQDELSYDMHYQNADRIYSVTTRIISSGSTDHIATSPMPLARALQQTFADVEAAGRFKNVLSVNVRYGEHTYKEKEIFEADADVLTIFKYTFREGNPETALSGPDKIVITEAFRKKYFDNETALNKMIVVNNRTLTVSGVIDNLPENTDFKFSALIPFESRDEENWFADFAYYTYVLLRKELRTAADQDEFVNKKLHTLANEHLNAALKATNQNTTIQFSVDALRNVHFRPALLGDTPKGNKQYAYIFSLVAICILIIACFNYINFSIVRSIERTKEVGIQKAIGASLPHLVSRYIGESVFTVIIALVLSFIIVIPLLPVLNDVAGKNFSPGDLLSFNILGFVCFILVVVGLLTGSYPAFYVSSIQPAVALKGKIKTFKGMLFRKMSIVTQFAISIGMIICTAIVFAQMSFVQEYDLGFRKRNTLIIDVPSDSLSAGKIAQLKRTLMANSAVESTSITAFGAVPGGVFNKGNVRQVVDGESRIVNFCFVDHDYLNVLEIPLKEGRMFNAESANDRKYSAVVNESFVKRWNMKKALGENVVMEGETFTIIGVMKDVHFLSLFQPIEPLMLRYQDKEPATHLLVSFNNKTAVADQVGIVKNEWNNAFVSSDPFVYSFLDESLAAQYTNEDRMMSVFTIFSVFTIVISCLGLFGVCSLAIYQRRKEVGIRKVNGASPFSIITLVSKEYVLLVLLSFVIVCPVVWYLMDKWLQSFLYRSSTNVLPYLLTGIIVTACSLATIVFSVFTISRAKATALMIDK